MEKAQSAAVSSVSSHDVELAEQLVHDKAGTSRDAEDMRRLGRVQELRRNFGPLSIFGFALILMSTWQNTLASVAFALPNGGTAGILYMYILTIFCYMCVNASMAEMASMAPTAGGQYHWVSEFAPRSAQKIISYFIGWLCSLGWISGTTIGCFLAGTQIQGLIALNYDAYVFERWHGTLLAIALVLFCAIFNIFLARHLPMIEGLCIFLHLGGFIAIFVSLWALGPRGNSHEIWTKFEDLSGWGSTGLATLVGLMTPVTSLLGADAAVHMAEELKDASRTLPKAMIWTTTVNGVLGFAMIITFLYTLGDLQKVLDSPTGFPFIQVFYDVTGSKAGATVMTLILTLSSFMNALTNMQTASRQLWAFARDNGVPFRGWFSKVQPTMEIPLNAIIFISAFTAVLSMINIGSTTAYYQINSLGIGALIGSYMISIGCITWRRLTGQPLLDSPFKLGKLGLPINLISMAFLALVWTMSFFPLANHPTVSSMNWASFTFSSVIIIGALYYFFRARHHYVGPVEYVVKGA